MITLATPAAPPCLAAFAAMDPPPDFGIPAFVECKGQVREKLLANQHYQCAYCERPIEDRPGDCHLDHVHPQSKLDSGRFVISNLVASCETDTTCGKQHADERVPDELNPYLSGNLHLAFDCSSEGELFAVSLSEPVAQFANAHLGLNDPGLKTVRSIVIAKLMLYIIGTGTNPRKRLKTLSTRSTGFLSLHFKLLGRFGFSLPS